MLRPELYRRLRALFGAVSIANEDEEAMGVYRGIGADQRLTLRGRGEYLRTNCPLCRDTRQRLWIHHLWGLKDQTGRRNLWLAICYNENCLAQPGAAKRLYDYVFSEFGHEADVLLPGKLPETIEPLRAEWPGEVVLVKDVPDHPAAAYLRGRGFDLAHLSDVFRVGVCLCADPKYLAAKGRIIIPVFENGELVGWQARYVGAPPNKHVPKYHSMAGMRKNRLLYNFAAAKAQRHVVVVEGAADVWRFGPEAVALFGKTASAHQLNRLSTVWEKIFIVLDGDALIDAQGLYDALGTQVEKILVELPPGRDPGGMPTEELRALVFGPAQKKIYA